MRTDAGSILGSGNIFSLRLVMKSFLRPFSTADSCKAVVSYCQKDVHLVLVNCLGSLPRNSVVKLTDLLDMTIVADWDIKPQNKQSNHKINYQSTSLHSCDFVSLSNSILCLFFIPPHTNLGTEIYLRQGKFSPKIIARPLA